jgi:hypothetical protein
MIAIPMGWTRNARLHPPQNVQTPASRKGRKGRKEEREFLKVKSFAASALQSVRLAVFREDLTTDDPARQSRNPNNSTTDFTDFTDKKNRFPIRVIRAIRGKKSSRK